MKKRDLLIAAMLLAFALAVMALNFLSAGEPGKSFTVTLDGREVLRATLSRDGEYPIRQPDGAVNVITVENGQVYVREANCRDGLCMRQGRTKTAAKTLVCLPHKLVVTVIKDETSEPDDLDIII